MEKMPMAVASFLITYYAVPIVPHFLLQCMGFYSLYVVVGTGVLLRILHAPVVIVLK